MKHRFSPAAASDALRTTCDDCFSVCDALPATCDALSTPCDGLPATCDGLPTGCDAVRTTCDAKNPHFLAKMPVCDEVLGMAVGKKRHLKPVYPIASVPPTRKKPNPPARPAMETDKTAAAANKTGKESWRHGFAGREQKRKVFGWSLAY